MSINAVVASARRAAGLLLLSALMAGPALAAGCPAHYVDGRMPEIRNPKLASATRELCYSVFGIMHSGLTRTPLWSAEYLQAGNVEAAHLLTRENSFHAEPQLPPSQRAELSDYAHSGYDRGHMAPNGDMPNRLSQQESFTLANMVPQNAENNRHTWAAIEGAVRKMVRREGGLYVLTGPAFLGTTLQKAGNVLVPSHLYKVVYSPRQQRAAAWFVLNQADDKVQVLSVAELEERIGIDLLPSLSKAQKQRMLRLPKLKQKGRQ